MKTLLTFYFLLFISCSKIIEYEFKINNQTKYYLKEVSFDWCNGNKKISIYPNSSLDFNLEYKTSGFNNFSPGSLCITLLSYSDSISDYFNNNGVSIERHQLNKKQLNNIKISEIRDNNNIFLIELN
jgi:hypothetical protein